MSPVAFICETESERLADLGLLGNYLEGMGYDVHSHRDLCSPAGQRFIYDRPPDDDSVVLICPRQLGREVFEGVLDPEWQFFSFRMQGEPKELANHILSEVHPDTAALRRYLVDEDIMTREHGEYWRAGGTFDPE